MNARRTDQLTGAERACLRLVMSHHNSKEIAVLMGVSPSASDKRVERAVQILGATGRFEAARILSDEERDARLGDSPSTYERLPSDAIDLPPTSEDRSEPGHVGPWGSSVASWGWSPDAPKMERPGSAARGSSVSFSSC